MFTIELLKINSNNTEFCVLEFEAKHKECGGGRISVDWFWKKEQFVARCWRCSMRKSFDLSQEQKTEIAKIAVRGGKIEVEKEFIIIQE